MARHLYLHGVQHPIPETHQRRVSVTNGHFLKRVVRRRQFVGLVVPLCRSASAWVYEIWLCPLCDGVRRRSSGTGQQKHGLGNHTYGLTKIPNDE